MKHKINNSYPVWRQIVIMLVSSGLATWCLAEMAKLAFYKNVSFGFNPWTLTFLNPTGSSLINYGASSSMMLLIFIVLYVKKNNSNYKFASYIKTRASTDNKYLTVAIMSLVVVSIILYKKYLNLSVVIAVLTAVLSFMSSKTYIYFENIVANCTRILKQNTSKFVIASRVVVLAASLFQIMAIGWEVYALCMGPVPILNEYLSVPSTLMIDGHYVNVEDIDENEFSVNEIKKIKDENLREYFYQVSNRGAFLHIGHILNPINEMINGKDVEKIYFQYGIGNSYIYKWTMDYFGGFSFQNYFRCHMYYAIYWLMFLMLTAWIFRSLHYFAASAVIISIGFYMVGYDVFVIAPGVNPLVHFCDIALLFFLYRYFEKRNYVDLIMSGLVGAVGVIINPQFGLMGMAAAVISLSMYYIEKGLAGHRYWRLWLLPLLIIVPLIISRCLLPVATDAMFGNFLKGYFSFSPKLKFVLIIITNAAISYSLLLNKKINSPLRYALIFLTFYFQSLAVYYYWSGLSNHFWPIFPIMGLQLLVMSRIFNDSNLFEKQKTTVLVVSWVVLLVLLFNSSKNFYSEKKSYTSVFDTHKTYIWDFERAKIRTTIDPTIFKESINLINRYSENSHGIVLLSVFDNILPILASKYSLLPYFETQWFLITKDEVEKTISRIKTLKPQYVYVGHEVEVNNFHDPWLNLFEKSVFEKERISAEGRLYEMKKIFLAIKNEYKPIDCGKIVTVYKRND